MIFRVTTAVSQAWDAEYARGRYLDEAPVPFVDDILTACQETGLAGARCLYIGCGNGRNLLALAQAGLDVLGLDVSATAISQLAERVPGHRDRLVVGDLTSLPSDATYPVVVGIQVFQHGNRAVAHEHIRQAQRRVAAGGLFALRVNAVGTDVYPAHEIIEQWNEEGFTVRYVEGSKAGLDVHFFAKTELKRLFVRTSRIASSSGVQRGRFGKSR